MFRDGPTPAQIIEAEATVRTPPADIPVADLRAACVLVRLHSTNIKRLIRAQTTIDLIDRGLLRDTSAYDSPHQHSA